MSKQNTLKHSGISQIRIANFCKNIFVWLCLFLSLLLISISLLPEHQPIKNLPENKHQIAPTPTISFADRSLVSGLNHQHSQHTGKITDLIDSLSASACVADFNNDGWMDIVFPSGGGQTRYYGAKSWWNQHKNIEIYQNQSGYFVNKSERAGLEIQGSTTACITADLNNDGLTDIVISGVTQSRLFKNLGDFTFEAITDFTDHTQDQWVSHISVSDINADGLLDLHLSKFIKYRKNQKNLENATGFSEQHHRQFEPGAFDGIANQLLINQGKFKFSDKTQDYLKHLYADRTLSANWLDLNQDGLLDLIEFNLAEQPTRTYIQTSPGIFSEQTHSQWPLLINHSHFADAYQNIHDTAPLMIVSRAQGLSNLAFKLEAELQQDLAWKTGLNASQFLYQNRWGLALADFNNNGLTDFALATGGYKPDPFSPQASLASPNLCGQKQNTTEQGFNFQIEACIKQLNQSSRSAVKLDANNDGKMDLLFVNNNDFPQLLLNQSPSDLNWISLQIDDLANWYSASLMIKVGDKKLNKTVSLSHALFGNHDPRFHFGLGHNQQAEIRLKSIEGQIIQQTLTANQFYRLSQNRWQVISMQPADDPDLALGDGQNSISDLATAIRTLHNTSVNLSIQTWIQDLTARASSAQIKETAQLVQNNPNRLHVALYLDWINSKHADLVKAAFQAIQDLEQENTSLYLLDYLTAKADTNRFCASAAVFAHWFEQEEAVTRFKYKAVPYLFRALSFNQDTKIICAAHALGHAEHKNAADAILAVLSNQSVQVQAALVNALGKTRQREANSSIIRLIQSTQSAELIQQGLIALIRLNQRHMHQVVSGIKDKEALFTALINLPQATDNIVVKPDDRRLWLSQISPSLDYAKLHSNQVKQAYLKAATENLVTEVALWPVLKQADNPSLAKTAADILIQQTEQKVAQYSTQQIRLLLDYPLTTRQLIRLITYSKLSQPQKIIPSELKQLNHWQMQNLVSVFNQLSDKHQRYLAAQLSVLPVNNLNLALGDCVNSTPTISMSGQSTQLQAYILACELIYTAHKPNLDELKYKLTMLSRSTIMIQESVFPFLNYFFNDKHTTYQSKLALARLSAGLLNQVELRDKFKHSWAIRYFQYDKTALGWVKNQLADNNELLLNQLLTQGYFEPLSARLDLLKLNPQITPDTRQRLNSFYLQANLQPTDNQEAIQ